MVACIPGLFSLLVEGFLPGGRWEPEGCLLRPLALAGATGRSLAGGFVPWLLGLERGNPATWME